MKKIYVDPLIETVFMGKEDVIRTSVVTPGENELPIAPLENVFNPVYK